MSGALIVLSGQKLAYKWSRPYRVLLSHKYVIKDFHVNSTTQYCISTKDKNRQSSEIRSFKLESLKVSNHVSRKNTLDDVITETINDAKENTNKLIKYERLKDSMSHKRLERLYPQPLSTLSNIYAVVRNELKDETVLSSSSKNIRASQLWEMTYNVTWPGTMSFEGIGKSKTLASKAAALKCLHWLEMNGKLKNGKPIIYDRTEIKNMQSKATEINISSEILNDMKNLINIYNTELEDIRTKTDLNTYSNNALYPITSSHPVVSDIDYENIDIRNEELKQTLLQKQNHIGDTLPIFQFRDEILSKLENNRVLLIEGDTGCGKTTQVPQFIMDSFAQNGNATDCNILISQPRRISAISLADRVANEREEDVGDVVGYQVRLEQLLPKQLGGILFCTTGILLKKLQSNPSLKGCSHVILDEVHERSIDTDMLMILLKRALKKNLDLKVVVMSATLNAHLIQQYFDCAAIKVPGRLYPVKMNFLEDIERLPNIRRYKSYKYSRGDDESEMLTVNCEKIIQIIKWISQYKPHGAILCFLPGWHEITKIQTMLEEMPLTNEEQLVLPIHSKVTHDAQRKIFTPTPEGTRKIILATDIAETGITISDVSYVVDSAIRKESRWDEVRDLPCIRNRWVSKANIHQRKGRAGRVKPGISYHLIAKTEYEKLEPYPTPQILCNSLEKVILDSKTYTDEKAEDFLGCLLEPPNPNAIRKAITYLIDLGVVDEDENLTTLGRRMALFSTHPKFSKAIVYSSIFNCVHPMITIASIFSAEDTPFYGILDNKGEIRENKKLYHPYSDHIALSWIYKQYVSYSAGGMTLMQKFCKEMKLRLGRMEILHQIRDTFIQQLIQCHLLPRENLHVYNDFENKVNKYESNDELVRALVYSATQQLIEHKSGGFKNGVLRKDKTELIAQGRSKVLISGESVNYKRKVWPSPYLTYFHSAHCITRRSTIIREASVISPITALLFNPKTLELYEREDGKVEIVINVNNRHNLRFSCDKENADVLLEFRDIMWFIVQYSLEKQGYVRYDDNDSKQVFRYKEKLLETLAKTLEESSKCIETDENDKLNVKSVLI